VSETNGNGNGDMHAALKVALSELLPDMLRQSQTAPVAQVPAPPVAGVHRPSSWRPSEPAAPPATGTSGVEHVRLQDDRDLDVFVRSLARRLEHPGERAAILSGTVRFSLVGGSGATPRDTAGAHRIDRGAVTERIVERAAADGHDLVLGPKAVLTPMGKDRARALGVQIQRETAC
jgi:hypothetical protein